MAAIFLNGREMFESYYELLGIEQDASLSDIKKAFRRKAKDMHPDTMSNPTDDDLDAMRRLLMAYEVLSDPYKREEYDRHLAVFRRKKTYVFDYREFLQNRRDDLESQAKLVFFDLLHDRDDDAIGLYESLRMDGFSVEAYLDREDAMDCLFLIAEAYEKRAEPAEAVNHLLRLSAMEKQKPYFRHFFDEVILRLKKMLITQSDMDIELAMMYIEELLSLGCLSDRDEFLFCKRMADFAIKTDNTAVARYYLKRASALNGNLSGFSRLQRKLLQEEPA
ncbi:DnaJ domain-containing protein [Spirochaetia bacterium 38H-sp]|uniref:DnaJ domain-containing protein n=1 Tax=Rarispira pelagica TaxID=3141764 RepID=A0ABU9UCZ1_9SPIR